MVSNRALIASLTVLATATALFLGYALYFDHKRKKDISLRKRIKNEKDKEISKRKMKNEKEATKPNIPTSSIIEMIPEMSLTLEEIYAMPPADRERIFYSLLVKGEELLSFKSDEPNLMKTYSEVAVQLFFKAIKMIPNPTELLVSLQQVLPKEIFNSLTKLITEDGLKKVVTYFASIVSPGTSINISPRKLILANGETEQTWAIFATTDIPAGTILYEEKPDAASLFIDNCNKSSFCDNCFKSILENSVICKKCNDVSYCSEDCLLQASLSHHSTLCDNEYIKDLLKIAKTEHSEYALLVARYLSVLCAEEKKIREAKEKLSAAASSHFEYMKPLLLPVMLSDEKIAAALKLLFARISPDIVERKFYYFILDLNEQRYSSIKGTLLFNSIGIPNQSRSSIIDKFSGLTVSDESTKENSVPNSNTISSIKEEKITSSRDHNELMLEKQEEEESAWVDDTSNISSPVMIDSPIVESIHSNVSSDEGRSMSINELIEHTRSTHQKTELIGHGIYHISAHLQHSCDPNIKLSFPYGNNVLQVITTRHIEKGDEITMSYIPLTLGMSSNARRTALKASYHIDCICILCEAELVIA